MIRDGDVSLAPLEGTRVAVIGYGNQGQAHALNLRDSGLDVVVGTREGPGRVRASRAGFERLLPGEAASVSDVIMMLLPDEEIAPVFRSEVLPVLRSGATIGVAHGSAIHFGIMEVPSHADVFLVAPTGPGLALRTRYLEGSGIPAVFAVHHDATGLGRGRALAYAKAIGCTRAGLFETTLREESIIDLFGEQAALCGGLASLVTGAFRTLVEAGYSPTLAYLECVRQIELTAGLVSRLGLAGMWDAVSNTAAFGGLTNGPSVVGEPARAAMRQTLRSIETGEFFTRFLDDARQGGVELARLRSHAIDAETAKAEKEVLNALAAGGNADAEN